MSTTWSCGIRALPATIDGDPPTPTVGVLWACNGLIVAAEIFEGDCVTDAQLRGSFEKAVAEPARGAPVGRPRTICAASEVLASRLESVLPDVRVEVRPTPDTDDAFESLAASLSRPMIDPVAQFMEMDEVVRQEVMPIAMKLFNLRPWELFPADIPVQLSIPSCDVSDGRLSIMGHNGEEYGLMLFTSQEDFEVIAACGRGMLDPSDVMIPKCYSLNYEAIDPERVGEGPTAGPVPLPILTVFDRDMQRAPSPSEAKPLLAAMEALARFGRSHQRDLPSRAKWRKGIRGRYRVSVLGEKLEVKLMAKE